jgi:protein SCO1
VIGLVACGFHQANPEKFVGTDLTGTDFGGDFVLTDHHGNQHHFKDYVGKTVVLFFGYTHCPDVCPTTLSDLAKAMKLLGAKADKIQVLFVTLDPERDTQDVLAKFVPSFDPRFVGLYGSPQQIEQAAKTFKVFYEKQASDGKLGYTIDHNAGSFVFDKQGKVRIYFKFGQKPDEMVSDLNQIL